MTHRTTTRQDRIKGALYGFAIGDAMGATTEFMSKEAIRDRYGRITCIKGGGWLDLKPGEVTDDTEMTFCVARAYLNTKGKLHITEFLTNCTKEFTTWLASGPKDVGNSCRAAITRNALEPDPYCWMSNNYLAQVEEGREDLGNGALMRCLYPILCGDLGAAILQAKLTHNNSLNDELILDYGLMVQDALEGRDLNIQDCAQMDPTGHIWNTLNNAVYWAMESYDFASSILGPVNSGGDADTIAAITGGLTGAVYGFDDIPVSWVNQLDPEIRKTLDYLAEQVQ